jgi:hypothetical protein
MKAVHRGYTASSKWDFKIKKATLNKHIWVDFLIEGYAQGAKLGFAEKVNFDWGVCRY